MQAWRISIFVVGVLAGCTGDLTLEGSTGPSAGDGGTAPLTDAGLRAPPQVDASPPIDASAPPVGHDAGPPDPLPVDAGTDPAPPPGDLTPEELDLLGAINDERQRLGLSPVAVDERLLCAARRHALDVGGSGACGHVGADGSWPWDRAEACGFPQDSWTVNEIAAGPGFDDGADAVWGWSHSSGHYAALTHERARTVGVAVHRTCFIALFDCCVAGSE